MDGAQLSFVFNGEINASKHVVEWAALLVLIVLPFLLDRLWRMIFHTLPHVVEKSLAVGMYQERREVLVTAFIRAGCRRSGYDIHRVFFPLDMVHRSLSR